MQDIQFYQETFINHLEQFKLKRNPETLYQPINYILDLGGKRLRPVLALMSSEIFDGDCRKALDAALCIEVFHNFTLIHDDIMDAAPLRRGKETVHLKWDLNTGILSGDAMLILAYHLLEGYEQQIFKKLAKVFSKTALEVCEGQQYDMDFETSEDVSISDYIKMIEYKTAVLLGAAMKMGAIVANASDDDQERIYEFGKNLGIAFQLQDDYLDTFGDPKIFGKQVGGDIIANKKTFLYLKAIEKAFEKDKIKLHNLFRSAPKNPSEKITEAREIFTSSGAHEATLKEIQKYTDKAFTVLEYMSIANSKKMVLRQFGEQLMNRNV